MFDEMKRYIGFGPDDTRRLAELWPLVEPHAADIIDHFYSRILTTPAASDVIVDEAQVQRLKRTLRTWLAEVFQGPHDHAYFERRTRIGYRHVEVGLPPRFMFTAMSVIYQDLCAALSAELDQNQLRKAMISIRRITDLDLAVMTGTFIAGREERQIHTLQELIVSHMPVTVLLVDSDGTVTAATRQAATLGADGGNPVGLKYTEALPAELTAAADLENQVRAAMSSGKPASILRVDARIDNQNRTYRLTIVPLDHVKARVLLHLDDLSEAVATETRLRRAEALAQLGALSAAVAHELRNPLAGISGAIQVIMATLEHEDERRSVLVKIDAQIQRLNALVTDLLTFARPSEARLAVVDLGEIVEGVASLAATDRPGIRIVTEGSGAALADPSLVHRVLLNVVQNAVNALGGTGKIAVLVSDGQVRVDDSGPGVAEELRDDIFEPFFTTRSRGTGLGLAISKRAAENMGGQLSLESNSSLGGASFALTLRRAEASPPPR